MQKSKRPKFGFKALLGASAFPIFLEASPPFCHLPKSLVHGIRSCCIAKSTRVEEDLVPRKPVLSRIWGRTWLDAFSLAYLVCWTLSYLVASVLSYCEFAWEISSWEVWVSSLVLRLLSKLVLMLYVFGLPFKVNALCEQLLGKDYSPLI